MQDAGKTLEELIVSDLVAMKLVMPDLAISKKLRTAIFRLSDVFTRERAELPKNYFDDEINRCAYLAAFVLTNAAKVVSCLKQLAVLLPKEGPLTILDIGSGPGTAVFAASSFFSDRDVRFVALEKNKHILDEARALEVSLPNNHSVEWVADDLDNLPGQQFDLAIAANVLNELEAEEQFRVCKNLLSISDLLLIIDPALKQTSRKLMALHDQLINADVAAIHAPCTHQRPCPMLRSDSPSPLPLSPQGRGLKDAPQQTAGRRSSRDWCHFYLEWQRPKLIEAIDRATGLDHRYLKYAYLSLRVKRSNLDLNNKIAASPGAPRNDICGAVSSSCASRSPLHAPRSWRVVSAPRKSKGKLELIVCGSGKLKRLRRLDKNASETNADFGRAKRGDLVVFLTEKERPGEIRTFDNFSVVKLFSTQSSNPSGRP